MKTDCNWILDHMALDQGRLVVPMHLSEIEVLHELVEAGAITVASDRPLQPGEVAFLLTPSGWSRVRKPTPSGRH